MRDVCLKTVLVSALKSCEITDTLSGEKPSAPVYTQIHLYFVKLNISENEKVEKVRKV